MAQQIKITQTSNADMNIGILKNLTAVEWLALRYHHRQGYLSQDDIAEAKAMEKEHIMKAFSDGQETPISHPNLPHYSKEEYYEEKYNNGK
jgi:hypothetical protein